MITGAGTHEKVVTGVRFVWCNTKEAVFTCGMTDSDEVRALQQISGLLRGRFVDVLADRMQMLVSDVSYQYNGRPVRE